MKLKVSRNSVTKLSQAEDEKPADPPSPSEEQISSTEVIIRPSDVI
jgi:hypothetical protein